MVRCADCATEFDADESEKPDQRTPCPTCGSIGRAFVKVVNESVRMYETYRLVLQGARIKSGGRRRPSRELIQGHEFSEGLQRMVLKRREIDRANDMYEEKVVNSQDGTVMHQCKERLSDHKGHGSARARFEVLMHIRGMNMNQPRSLFRK